MDADTLFVEHCLKKVGNHGKFQKLYSILIIILGYSVTEFWTFSFGFFTLLGPL